MTHRRGPVPRAFDVAGEVDGLRQFVSRADALVHSADGLIASVWTDDDDGRRWERLGHLVSSAVEALRMALASGDRIAAGLAKRQKDA